MRAVEKEVEADVSISSALRSLSITQLTTLGRASAIKPAALGSPLGPSPTSSLSSASCPWLCRENGDNSQP